MFKQPVAPIKIEHTSRPRQDELTIISENLFEPQFMSRQELTDSGVTPDFDDEEFSERLKDLDELNDYERTEFMERFFDAPYGHGYENTIDHTAIQFDRGDARLSISALKLMEEGIVLLGHDNSLTVVCGKNVCIAAIVQSWVGGDATCNLLIDFRHDTPHFQKIDFGNESCVDAITTTDDGEIVVRNWWKKLGQLDKETLENEVIANGQAFEIAQRAFRSIPRNPEIAGWVYPWPFEERNWDELPN